VIRSRKHIQIITGLQDILHHSITPALIASPSTGYNLKSILGHSSLPCILHLAPPRPLAYVLSCTLHQYTKLPILSNHKIIAYASQHRQNMCPLALLYPLLPNIIGNILGIIDTLVADAVLVKTCCFVTLPSPHIVQAEQTSSRPLLARHSLGVVSHSLALHES
jgi:hypothetical protein